MDKAQILNIVYAAKLPSRDKTVMFYLINRANKELTCFPAVPTIAREVGMSERTVQRALKELCEVGFIEKTPRYRENGGQSSNLYVLLGEASEVNDEEEGKQQDCSIKGDIETPVCKGEFVNERRRTETTTTSECEKDYIKIKNFGIGISGCKDNFTFIRVDPNNCHRVGGSFVPP